MFPVINKGSRGEPFNRFVIFILALSLGRQTRELDRGFPPLRGRQSEPTPGILGGGP
jgi:hypothetical protein